MGNVYADASEVYRRYVQKCGHCGPQRSLNELRALLSGMALSEDEIDGTFWQSLFDTGGKGDPAKAWAWNPRIRNQTVVRRYTKVRWAVFYQAKARR